MQPAEPVHIADLDYELPEELIAQEPLARREHSRLLHLPLDGARLSEHRFAELPGLLDPGDLLVLNDARVLPARLRARRPTGAEVELLLLERLAPAGRGSGPAGASPSGETWLALAGPARKAPPGQELILAPVGFGGDGEGRGRGSGAGAPGEIHIRVLESRDEGRRVLQFPDGVDVEALMEARGSMPLPPYIRRELDDPRSELDRRRYQTVYAARAGAVAAPTAGLHFTEALLRAIDRRGVELVTLTLDVGLGTFQPIRASRPEDHEMLPERYRIPPATVEAVSAVRRRGGRVVAVGTTVVRALEHAAAVGAGGDEAAPDDSRARLGPRGTVQAGTAQATLFITPGFEFRVVDGMVTNFHLPRSTPLLMVAALAGPERLLEAYRVAVERRFRFYSYGDAMLLL